MQELDLKERELDLKEKSLSYRERLLSQDRILNRQAGMQHYEPPRTHFVDTDHKLTINTFSGLENRPKHESSLEEWKAEIRSIVASGAHSARAITQAMRQSLKGPARRIIVTLSPTATISEILQSVEDIYGNMSSKHTVYREFYTAHQWERETVADWGLRLEDIMQLLQTKRNINEGEKQEMLRETFWRGLANKEIKSALRSAFESKESFEILRRKARAEEHELTLPERQKAMVKQQQVHTAAVSDKKHDVVTANEKKQDETMKLLLKRIEDLEKKLEEKESQRGSFGFRRGQGGSYRGYRRGGYSKNGTQERAQSKPEGSTKETPLNK